uniref:Symplekin C-terminal domain-containing protein n=1 Tax=Aegilops tauschii subsp. strangulata TaxID=200361 RepID=A0A453FBB6_AEGTS
MLESKEVLVRRLRALSPGEATEQIIRQAEKMSRNIERACRTNKDEHPTWEMSYGDVNRKNSAGRSSDTLAMAEGMAKRARFDSSAASNPPVQGIPDYSEMQIENDAVMGHSSDPSLLSTGVSPVEKMIEMIGALLAEGERGAESLGILISSVESDVMADIVIETMKHLPEAPFPLARNKSVPQPNLQSPSNPSTENLPGNLHSLPFTAQSVPSADGAGISPPEVLVMPGVSDSKRDPRRDPRRLDPRRTVAPAATSPMQMTVEITSVHQTNSLSNTLSPLHGKIEKCADYSADPPKNEDEEHPSSKPHQPMDEERSEFLDDSTEPETKFEVYPPVEAGFPSSDVNEEMSNPLTPEAISNNGSDSTDLEVGPFSPVSKTSTPEDTNHELPLLPSHLELSDSEKISLHKLAIGRIIDDYKKNSINSRFSLLAHLVAQSTADDNIMDLIQTHIILHNHDQKGHELAMHVLYQLQCVNVADAPESSISTSEHYEKFFISLAKLLIDVLPASDKSFSKLLCDAPCLPESLFRFLEGLCMSQGNNQQTKDSEGDRVTQGLGTVWSLILGRPPLRQACLDIVLKCAIHSQDEVRGKAVRLVAKKLYDLTYASEKVEQFATDSLLAIANKHGVSTDVNFTTSKESTSEVEVSNQEASVSGSQISDAGPSASGSTKTSLISPKQSAISVSEAKRHTSLFFALCTKILQTLTEESNPSANLVVAVKHLYETKLKDASILIPLLSSFPKEEVLPIFPRLVDLSPDRFQDALARILQGSAHTGPALTPAEVLIAIHDINPEKDKVPLKKVIDACTACFEQRTVFTQQVLEKALNKLVDNVPIPLLFMRTVIQALDAFPALVDFVMGILSRLVNKQIWKMPKLWVGFLKLAYQTQPRSFDVLLQVLVFLYCVTEYIPGYMFLYFY